MGRPDSLRGEVGVEPCRREGKDVVFESFYGKVDIIQVTLDQSDALQLDETGGLILTIRVCKPTRGHNSMVPYVWKIDQLEVQVFRIVGEP